MPAFDLAFLRATRQPARCLRRLSRRERPCVSFRHTFGPRVAAFALPFSERFGLRPFVAEKRAYKILRLVRGFGTGRAVAQKS